MPVIDDGRSFTKSKENEADVDATILKKTKILERNISRLKNIWAIYLLDAIRKNYGGLKELEEKRFFDNELAGLEDSWKEKQGKEPYDPVISLEEYSRRWREKWEEESILGRWYFYDSYRRDRDDWEEKVFNLNDGVELSRDEGRIWEVEEELSYYYCRLEQSRLQWMRKDWEEWTSHTKLKETFRLWGKEMERDVILNEIRRQYEDIRQLKEKKTAYEIERRQRRITLYLDIRESILRSKAKTTIISPRILKSMIKNTEDRIEPTKRMSDELYKRENEHLKKYQVLDETKFLPRYIYHRSLLHSFGERLQYIPEFKELTFKECCILLGGSVNKENRIEIFNEAAPCKETLLNDLSRGADGDDILMVYFLTNDEGHMEEIIQLGRHISPNNGTILFVVNSSFLNDEYLCAKTTDDSKKFGFTHVEFVEKSRYDIISKMTCILEKRITVDLQNIKHRLIQCSSTQNVGSRLLEVHAILRRLRQAACYPVLITEDDEEEDVGEIENAEVDEIIERFGDKILYHGYDGEKHYVITTEEGVMETLITSLSKLPKGQAQFAITVQNNVEVEELTRPGVPLHGAKFVYVNNGVDSFRVDRSFATTGSLMLANGNSLVVVTCRHALQNDPIYVLIDDTVVKLGRQVQQSNNNMERIDDDIALVKIEDETRPLLNEKCEKLLIDKCGIPSPARTTLHNLKKNDIVHKRGASTGLTTGLVSDIRNNPFGKFKNPARFFYIKEMDNGKFAEPGDSGSLVFQHSLSPVENVLYVVAIVQGRMKILPFDAVCFPFQKGCETLIRNIDQLSRLEFIDK
uniref:Uncharacterized protein LOC111134534 isoform X3 n=1 Tax=Crassostrea virginica TaxID=6565 RepID=A0A8B8EI19_CRAVI|nr:uncharacterized protein LOC111134534 isoform X3 [Crassostrea virginica]